MSITVDLVNERTPHSFVLRVKASKRCGSFDSWRQSFQNAVAVDSFLTRRLHTVSRFDAGL
jgi:hypothetical protein